LLSEVVFDFLDEFVCELVFDDEFEVEFDDELEVEFDITSMDASREMFDVFSED